MAKIKVTAFKHSGKYYTSEVYTLQNFPSVWNMPDITVKELKLAQVNESLRVWDEIKKGNMLCYCPVTTRWENFIFIFEGIFENNEAGFLTYLLNNR